jgi:carbon-monoxide dehydrogenase medium subunit
VKPAAYDYVRPRDLAEAGELLARSSGAKLLAGGQSLGPLLNMRLSRPELLIDISRVSELNRIEETDTIWRIGAGVTHAQLEDAAGRLHGAEMVSDVAAGIAYRSVRNRGTIGGSLAHADPAADWPLALAALAAVVAVRGPSRRSRRIPAETFMITSFTTALERDEIITAIEIPKRPKSARYGYFKFCRKTGEFPEASAAAVVDSTRGEARVFIGALNGAPRPLFGLVEALGRRDIEVASEEATRSAVPELDPIGIRMHAATVRQALKQVHSA